MTIPEEVDQDKQLWKRQGIGFIIGSGVLLIILVFVFLFKLDSNKKIDKNNGEITRLKSERDEDKSRIRQLEKTLEDNKIPVPTSQPSVVVIERDRLTTTTTSPTTTTTTTPSNPPHPQPSFCIERVCIGQL